MSVSVGYLLRSQCEVSVSQCKISVYCLSVKSLWGNVIGTVEGVCVRGLC